MHGDGLVSSLLGKRIFQADAMLAITDDDKTNMLAAVRAKSENVKGYSLINDPTMSPLTKPLG